MPPFTRDQFIATFVAYNEAVWPVQLVAAGLGVAILLAAWRPSPTGSRLAAAGLALMWAWTGVAYHGIFFARINRAAPVFGALFVVQALLLAYHGAWRGRLALAPSRAPAARLGWALLLYAAAAYPLVGLAFGQGLAELPAFGIAPCPVTLFTFGLLLLAAGPVPRWLVVIPLAWSLLGGSAAFMLGMPQDWPLLFSGLAAVWLWLRERRP